MEIAVAVVTSLDSRMTHGNEDNIHSWVSDEDQVRFKELRDSHDTLIMGSTTYKLMRGAMVRAAERLRVVLTAWPEEYEADAIPGQLEFHDKTVTEIAEYLESQNRQKALVVGGGRMITDFLRHGLVDKFYLTLEPKLFGEGYQMITGPLDCNLRLDSCEKANENGTLLLTYTVDGL
jgi:dihydrofolate reductase